MRENDHIFDEEINTYDDGQRERRQRAVLALIASAVRSHAIASATVPGENLIAARMVYDRAVADRLLDPRPAHAPGRQTTLAALHPPRSPTSN